MTRQPRVRWGGAARLRRAGGGGSAGSADGTAPGTRAFGAVRDLAGRRFRSRRLGTGAALLLAHLVGCGEPGRTLGVDGVSFRPAAAAFPVDRAPELLLRNGSDRPLTYHVCADGRLMRREVGLWADLGTGDAICTLQGPSTLAPGGEDRFGIYVPPDVRPGVYRHRLNVEWGGVRRALYSDPFALVEEEPNP